MENATKCIDVEKEKTISRKKRERKKNVVAYSFITPNFIGFAVFTLVPILFAFLLAFMEWDGSNQPTWAGTSNFQSVFSDSLFWKSIEHTIIYCIGTVPITMLLSLLLAIVLNQKVKGRAFFRTISFFPYVGSLVAITAVWTMIFNPTKGPVNAILYYVFHVANDNLPNWFAGKLVMVSYIMFSVWKYMGYYMVIYLAGLQNVNTELYEAASLDGANIFQKFRYVTLPQLRPTTFFVVVMLTINCFKIYDIAIMLAGGGDNKLGSSATVLVYYIYQNAFQFWKLGKSSAAALALFALVLIVTMIQFKGEERFAND